MQIKLNKVPPEMILRLKSVIRITKDNGCYLNSCRPSSPFPNIFSILLLVIYFFVFILNSHWEGKLYLVFIGPLIMYFFAREFQKYWNWRVLGKDAFFFDSRYCTYIENETLVIESLSEYKNSDIYEVKKGSYFKARFHFINNCIIIPIFKEDNAYHNFTNYLIQNSILAKASNEVIDVGKNVKTNFSDKFGYKKPAIITAVFTFIILWFIVPKIIDYNQFQIAKRINTATSYREYLEEKRNLVYRENARSEIKGLYDYYIKKYMENSYGVKGAKYFKDVLIYLRDKELYTIEMVFVPSSELQDISDRYYVKPVTPYFTSEMNAQRQNLVINTVKSSLNKIFPTDIVAISSSDSPSREFPRFTVIYSYKNKKESIYYPTKEENLPIKQRNLYYGIEIEWNFEISIKTSPNPIYSFSLHSEPAIQFSSETSNTDDVYSSMALSAFNDFNNEFTNRFFNN